MAEQIPLFEIHWARDDVLNAVDSITRGRRWANGPYIDEFEAKLRDYFDVDHAIVFNSGTTAIVTALKADGIQTGDEVIVPSFTFIATANAVRLVGANPVFTDIESKTFGLDPIDVKRNITDNTKAILPIHCYGQPCQIYELKQIAEDNNLLLIEDAAEAFGATYGNDKVGTIGDMGIFSFCQNKVMTTGEGGAVITNDHQLAERLRLHRSHGRLSSEYFDSPETGSYVEVGTNYRMSDLVASIGVAQIGRVEFLISQRRDIASKYTSSFSNIKGIVPPTEMENRRHVYQIYTILVPSSRVRNIVIESLQKNNISSKIYWDPPVHETPYYRKNECGYSAEGGKSLSTTEKISKRVLSLPIYPGLSEAQANRVITTVENAVKE